MIDAERKNQYDLWHGFKNGICYENRYFINNDKFVEKLEEIIEAYKTTIPRDTVYFRARKYDGDVSFVEDHYKQNANNEPEEETDDEDNLIKMIKYYEKQDKTNDWNRRESTNFWGYDSIHSFTPNDPQKILDGRANPSKIINLYLSDDPNAALMEVRPTLKSYVSIAEIKTIEDLTVVDLSLASIFKNEDLILLGYLISKEFSEPNNTDTFNYLPTQYISEYIKFKGFDGIKYQSSLYERGRNLVVYSKEKCTPISSKLYRVDDICYDALRIAPRNMPQVLSIIDYTEDLYHPNLEPYKESRRTSMIESLMLDHKPKEDT